MQIQHITMLQVIPSTVATPFCTSSSFVISCSRTLAETSGFAIKYAKFTTNNNWANTQIPCRFQKIDQTNLPSTSTVSFA